MTRAQIARERQRRLVEEAKDAWRVGAVIRDNFQYNDGTLVHHVQHARCRFDKRGGAPGAWSDYEMWSTTCGRILSVEKVHFTKSKKAVSCFACLGRR